MSSCWKHGYRNRTIPGSNRAIRYESRGKRSESTLESDGSSNRGRIVPIRCRNRRNRLICAIRSHRSVDSRRRLSSPLRQLSSRLQRCWSSLQNRVTRVNPTPSVTRLEKRPIKGLFNLKKKKKKPEPYFFHLSVNFTAFQLLSSYFF